MELRAAARLNRDAAPAAVCDDYLASLALAPEDRARIAHACAGAFDTRAAMTAMHRALADDSSADVANPAFASLRARLALAGVNGRDHAEIVADDPRRGLRLISAPPIRRTSMAPEPWRLGTIFPLLSRRRRAARADDSPSPNRRPWRFAAALRRLVLLFLVFAQTVLATDFMAGVLPYHGRQPLELGILALFAILILWVSAGFWTAMAGFVLQLRGHDRYAISARDARHASLADGVRTAIVMPICNEDVARVFAGLRATYDSVARTGELARFDFFVLSDSSDPDLRIAEREAWLDICRRTGGFERIFYRRRQHRIKRKSGNVADFCRRWGKGYDHMVVMDADSVMSGRCLVELMRLMQAHPHAGIIQTAPLAFGRETLYARIQQFATRVYGPLFVTGLHFWQLGESHYWGHNAIIRVAPFMKHCALGRLPGRGALSGEILSHDFVEAALMRRAGWGVWIAYDLPGSYEEMPPNLLDELKRDRRWCLGNLINSRLFFAHGLHPAHRAVFVTGVMAYLSAPLWFLFLVLSTVLLAVHVLTVPTYFVTPNQLFPLWPEWHPSRAIGLFTATATLLFLPKILAVALIAKRGAQHFGGVPRLAASTLLEIVFSMLLAPVRMLFHTQFIAAALLGWKLAWKSPPREDTETTWREAFRRHGLHTLIGLVWLALVYWLDPSFLGWLLPVAGALAVSIPISVFSSRVSLGRSLRGERLFLIPEESYPPRVLRRMRRFFRNASRDAGFVDAVVDPLHNAIACAADVARTQHSDAIRHVHEELVERALIDGPAPLALEEKAALLGDALALSRLHFAVWTADDAHPDWIRARRGALRANAPTASATRSAA
ncbi:MAG TPA: glucans biosynthesis glucosyltransferase MdoH [Rhodanobacteraceae bacterium]|jgi:membrane glycosyltransferase|nr:glucans biosynthesis glucosyltransferase MdoH [Rhodanobacteraceae bacterium]